MVDASRDPLPRTIRDAAADWVERVQRMPGDASDRALETWLASNPLHRAAYDAALDNWNDSAGLRATKLGQARGLVRAPVLMRRNTHIAAFGLAGAALVFVVAGRSTLLPIAGISEASAQTLKTAKGEIRTVILADGSKVTLDTETLVRVSITPRERRALLSQGRARFAIVADALRPFVIEASGRTMSAAAATVDVTTGKTGPAVSTLSGHVDVAPEAPSTGTTVTVAVGDQLDASSSSGIQRADPREAQWVSGMLVFDATSLDDAVVSMNRYSPVLIRLADTGLGHIAISGAFRVNDPHGFVRSVTSIYHLRVRRSADGAITLSKD